MFSQLLIEKVAKNLVSFWSNNCSTMETKCDVINSSTPCGCFCVMNISAGPALLYSCCTHGVSKTVRQSTVLAHGSSILPCGTQYSVLRTAMRYPWHSLTSSRVRQWIIDMLF